jgi:hypothetical protein
MINIRMIVTFGIRNKPEGHPGKLHVRLTFPVLPSAGDSVQIRADRPDTVRIDQVLWRYSRRRSRDLRPTLHHHATELGPEYYESIGFTTFTDEDE